MVIITNMLTLAWILQQGQGVCAYYKTLCW